MLTGRTALVTGSTSGIGYGIARQLASAGATIVLNGFGEREHIAQLKAALINEFGVSVHYHDADIARPADVRDLIGYTVMATGGLDILVNNAGVQFTAAVEDFPAEQWDQIMAVNLSSNFHAIKAALPHMKANNWGRIVNIASVHGMVGSASKAAYVAAKHGVLGLTKVVALETAQSNITCNAICPGWVLTPLVQKQIDNRVAELHIPESSARLTMLAEKQPSREFATPEQIGSMAAFLCSEAARQIRGAALTVDGGWTAQ